MERAGVCLAQPPVPAVTSRDQTRQQQFELFGVQTFILGAAEVTFEKQVQLLAQQFVFNGQLERVC